MDATEEFWRGKFGDDYSSRCEGRELIDTKRAAFQQVLRSAFYVEPRIRNVVEFGCNTGLNFAAMKAIPALGGASFTGVEINEGAAAAAREHAGQVICTSIYNEKAPWGSGFDLAISMGLLIHQPPEQLPAAYNILHQASHCYILVSEYHNPKPVEVEYHGHAERLWKRDFAGEMLALFDDLIVMDYWFGWRHDPYNKHDDLLHVLLKKKDAR